MTKLSSQLPKSHGLRALDHDLINDPQGTHLLIARVDCRQLITDTDTGDIEPVVRVLVIEAVHPDDLRAAGVILQAAAENRHGGAALPFDPETGEVLAPATP